MDNSMMDEIIGKRICSGVAENEACEYCDHHQPHDASPPCNLVCINGKVCSHIEMGRQEGEHKRTATEVLKMERQRTNVVRILAHEYWWSEDLKGFRRILEDMIEDAFTKGYEQGVKDAQQ